MSVSVNRTSNLSEELVQKILDRFGLTSVSNDYEGLAAFFKAWCRHVPFDNIQKRVHFKGENPNSELPGAHAPEFWHNFLTHGTGGTCWPTSEGMYQLLLALGFDVRRGIGSMLDLGLKEPNHATILVHLDGKKYLLDSTMLSEEPILLEDGFESEDLVHGIRTEYKESMPKVWWSPGHVTQFIAFRLEYEDVEHEFFLRQYEATKDDSLFNASVYYRVNTDEGTFTIGRDKTLIKRVVNGEVVFEVEEISLEERAKLLCQYGLSEEIVSLIPDDDEGMAFE